MAEIVNLRVLRKEKARAEAARRASENRARFGRPKAERDRARREAQRAGRVLDSLRLEREEGRDGRTRG
jgi:hypothetical protein